MAAPLPKKAESLSPAPPKLELKKWSGDLNVPDPVACSVDEKGRVYVSATTRRKAADLDIREHPMWIPNDVGFQSVEDKQAFYHEELAPGKMRAPRGSLKDHNHDGSIDWTDLTVHTERLYRLEDTDGDGTADRMTTFAEGFNTEVTGIAAGVLYHDGWVYATIAPDLWRFKDTDDDGVADIREIVVHGFGMHIAYAGHDMHGLRVGPDGRIYWSIGDKGVNVTSREGKHFFYPNQGCVMRMEPDGSNFEVFAHGVRNPQEIAFDDFGNIFAVDNDADQKGERERFIYITERSDSGWRCNYQYMKENSPWMREGLWKPAFDGQPAYTTPPLANYSDGPAGFAHEPGTAMGAAFRGSYFLNQFPSGRMTNFRIEPDEGAAFKMVEERLVNSGVMGIGMSWGPDGALYMADWVGGYPLDGIGAVWRVDDPAGKGSTERQETHKLLRDGFDQREVAKLQRLLAHRDQRVRMGAQFALVKKGRWDVLLGTATDATADLLARVHGIWGYGQGLRRGAVGADGLLPLLKDGQMEIRAQVAKVMGDAAGAKSQATALIPLLRDSSLRVRFLAAIALGKLEVPEAADELLGATVMPGNDGPWMRHALVTGLAGCAKPEQLVPAVWEGNPVRWLDELLALRRLSSPLVAKFLAVFPDEAARAIHDDWSIPAAMPDLAAMLGDARFKTEPAIRRAINANLRLGSAECVERVAQYALSEDAPADLRAEALNALLVWSEPPPLDLVDGRARKFEKRDPAALASVLQPRIGDLLGIKQAALKTVAVSILVQYELKVAAAQIAGIIEDPAAASEVRAEALKLMHSQHAGTPEYQKALAFSLNLDAPVALRMAAMDQAFADKLPTAVKEAEKTLQSRSTPEKQQAVRLLGESGTAEADAVLSKRADGLVAGKATASFKLELIAALEARSPTNQELAAKLATYQKSRPKGDVVAMNDDLLEGGDKEAGKEIVTNHLGANCLACHTVESSEGSTVGPNLKAVGAQKDRAYLLESLLNPVAKIVPGFGLVSVTLKDGGNVAGTLDKESKDAVTVKLADGTSKTLPRSEIASQTPPVSVMPPMLGILTKEQIRDVVAYLSSLKGKSKKSSGSEH